MANRDQYVAVRGKVQSVRKDSVLFSVGETVSRGAFVPRSLVHGADDKKLEDIKADMAIQQRPRPVEMTLRMFRWKAEELGFDGVDDKTADLFSRG